MPYRGFTFPKCKNSQQQQQQQQQQQVSTTCAEQQLRVLRGAATIPPPNKSGSKDQMLLKRCRMQRVCCPGGCNLGLDSADVCTSYARHRGTQRWVFHFSPFLAALRTHAPICSLLQAEPRPDVTESFVYFQESHLATYCTASARCGFYTVPDVLHRPSNETEGGAGWQKWAMG